MLSKVLGALALVGILTLSACSRKKSESVQLFYGECRVEVESSPHGAEILLDGIPVGHGSAKAEMPCGERQVRVEKPGYVPYLEYFQVTRQEPLQVTAVLEPLKLKPDFALSKDLLELAAKGKKIRDPWRDPLKPGEEVAEAEPSAAAPATPGSASGGANPPSSTPSGATGTSSSAEDWR